MLADYDSPGNLDAAFNASIIHRTLKGHGAINVAFNPITITTI
ncbi:hypothetical protein [Candidatus Nitrososphaera gargensis]|nr:hypothetical protein [Candidatus Nitrososphaera gargensis]